MSDDEDRTCPLCTEEMDLTDQQLKPCKCGYEICVWCWHSIIGMAEKDNTKGRCPACRTPYNKENIVAMAANCERIVTAAGRKQKSQKAKSKTTAEARKHLSSVRIVQRNVVYINGLPINLSDESLLERKEYFGQYGKILKVSISRLAGSSAQNASIVNTFSVYITYCREEEAIQCIQAVHNFVLEGKPLRACFGTAKYCYAWLRNMTCSNRNCLYLHEMASQEETFNKDEIISAYTRSRVPKIPSTYLQQRCGDVLPPPVDGYSTCVTSNKTLPKSATNNAAGHVGDSNSHAGNSTSVLPAAASWGLRIAPNYCPPLGNISCSQASNKLKGKSPDCSSVHSSAMVARQVSAWHDENVKASSVSDMNSLSRPLGPLKSGVKRDCSKTLSDVPSEFLQVEACVPDAWDDDIPIASNIPEERHVVAQSAEPATSSAIRITASSYVRSSAMAARQVSAWHDENVEASSVSDMNSLSRQSGPLKSGAKRACGTTASDVPLEILQVEACVPDAWDDDIPIASNIPEERHVVAQSEEPATSSAIRISASSYVHSSTMAARQVSAWHDENVEASSVSDMNSLSKPSGPLKSGVKRDCSTTASDVPSEILQVEACVPDAWDDDIPIASNTPEERHVVAQSVEPATSSAIQISARSYVCSSAMAARQVSAWHDENVEASSVSDMNSLSRPSGPLKSGVKRDCCTTASDVPSEILQVEACVPDAWDNDLPIASNIPEETHVVAQSAEPATSTAVGDLRISDSSSVRSSAMAARQVSAWHDENVEASIVSDMNSLSRPSRPLKSGVKRDCSTTASAVPLEILQVEACVSDAWDDDIPIASNIPEERHVVAQSVEPATSSVVGDLRISRLDTSSRTTSDGSSSSVISINSSSVYSTLAHDDKETGLFVPGSTENMVHMTRARTVEPARSNAAGDLRGSILDASSMMEDKSLSNLCKSEKVLELAEKNLTGEKVRSFGRYDGGAHFDKKTSLDVAGSSIIFDILPLDFEHWDDSLSLANGSLKLLGETNKEDGSLLLSTSWKSPITNQSRFSFAREENLLNQLGSIRELPAIEKSLPLLRDSYDSHQNIIGFGSAGGSYAINRVPVASSVGHSDLSWAKISAPPEFSSTRKAPGFSFQNKCEQTYRPAYSENNLHNSLCHQSQGQHSDNVVGEEIIDPAMLAVGREHMSLGISNSSTLGPTFPAQVTLVTDQSLMHHSVSSQISDHMWGRCLPSNDGYSGPLPVPQNCTSPSMFANLSLHQSKSSRILSNHWEGRNDTQNFDVRGMLDTMRNERSGFNNYYKGNDDVKFHTPNADHYNRECGM